jgi:hypothetical protein
MEAVILNILIVHSAVIEYIWRCQNKERKKIDMKYFIYLLAIVGFGTLVGILFTFILYIIEFVKIYIYDAKYDKRTLQHISQILEEDVSDADKIQNIKKYL